MASGITSVSLATALPRGVKLTTGVRKQLSLCPIRKIINGGKCQSVSQRLKNPTHILKGVLFPFVSFSKAGIPESKSCIPFVL